MRFSVIIPVTRPDWFRLTLAALLQQDLGAPEHELIVVDDCGGGGLAVMGEFGAALAGRSWRHIRAGDGAGRAAARNAGLAAATGEVVLFLDDDTLATPGLLRAHAEYQARGYDVVVEGKPHNVLTLWFPGWFEALSPGSRRLILALKDTQLRRYIDRGPAGGEKGWAPLITPQALAADFWRIGGLSYSHRHHLLDRYGEDLAGLAVPWIIGGSNNLAVRRSLLEQVGGFDQGFVGWGCEDLELEYRLDRAGARFALGTRAATYHQLHPRSQGEMLRDEGRNYKYFCRKHPTPSVVLYHRYRTRGVSVEAYSALAQRERRGALAPADLRLAERAYAQIQSLSDEALGAQLLTMLHR